MQEVVALKPFVKYIGGKQKYAEKILQHFPKTFNNYFEPFVGGGAMFYATFKKYGNSKQYSLSDMNEPLIVSFKVVKNSPTVLIKKLERYPCDKDLYYKMREVFNKMKMVKGYDETQFAAFFIYLNQCSFQGLYREDLKGNYNVPFGSKTQYICDSENILHVSKCLKKVKITLADYSKILKNVKKGDLVYLDPPYDESFVDYVKQRFKKDEQMKLKEFVDNLTMLGVYVIQSNSNTSFIRKLYNGYRLCYLETRYSVGNGSNKPQKELLIKNF